MLISTSTFVFATLGVVVVAVFGWWAYCIANRLDRLHVRYDLSWQALDAALARRAVVCRTIAAAVEEESTYPASNVVDAADLAERVDREDRERAENVLAQCMNAVAVSCRKPLHERLSSELDDANARVTIARRFHNDAVRDTLSLRQRFWVRALHLGGRAKLPQYIELADAPDAVAFGAAVFSEATLCASSRDADMGATAALDTCVRPSEQSGPRLRTAARVLLFDEHDRILLFRGFDSHQPDKQWWFTVGGEINPGESLVACALRETFEETGITLSGQDIAGPIWHRGFVTWYEGEHIEVDEHYFVARVHNHAISHHLWAALERKTVTAERWFTADELLALTEPFYPRQLHELFAEALRIADGKHPLEIHEIY